MKDLMAYLLSTTDMLAQFQDLEDQGVRVRLEVSDRLVW